MKMKISKLPFVTFLKKHQVYLLHCICDLAPYKFENIHGTKPQIKGTVRHATMIRWKRSAYGNGNIRTESHFLVRTMFSLYKKSWSLALRTNEIPLYMYLLLAIIPDHSILLIKSADFFIKLKSQMHRKIMCL